MKGNTTVKGKEPTTKSRPALTPEAWENQLISKTMALAERQIDEGTASSQVMTHFLKLGSLKAKLELEKVKKENYLLEVKAEAIKSGESSRALMEEAIAAFKGYVVGGDDYNYDEYDED